MEGGSGNWNRGSAMDEESVFRPQGFAYSKKQAPGPYDKGAPIDDEIPENFGVKDTNMEALKAKSAAIKLGYFADPFVKCFVKQDTKRDIVINRGYWSRTVGIQAVQQRFLAKKGDESDGLKRQIINIGCGYDTNVFSLFLHKDQHVPFKYVELDLKEVVEKKVNFIKNNPPLQQAFKGEELSFPRSDLLKSQNYALTSMNLLQLDDLRQTLVDLGVDFKMPTLIFAECVLAYIPAENIRNFIGFCKNTFSTFALLDYDMYRPDDPFGKMMVHNFKQRGIPLVGMEFFFSEEAIKKEYMNFGLSIDLYSMRDMYYKHLDQNERRRIERLEFLDELEEFWLVQEHYFMSLSKSHTTVGPTTSPAEQLIANLSLSHPGNQQPLYPNKPYIPSPEHV